MTDQLNTDNDHPLRRAHHNRILAGVASGIAEYLDVDVAVVRLAFVAVALLGGAGLPLYAAAWLLIPEKGSDQSVAAELLQRHQVA